MNDRIAQTSKKSLRPPASSPHESATVCVRHYLDG